MSPFDFVILPFTADNLYGTLSSDNRLVEVLPKNEREIYIYRYLQSNAKSIVVEQPYVDGDFMEDFATYYVRCYKPYNRFCKRLHFFGLEKNDLMEALEAALFTNPESAEMIYLNDNYLGFVVSRSLPNAIIGRTILKPQHTANHIRYEGIKTYHAHPFGLNLSVDSIAFQEQDSVLAACATVSLWSCLHITSEFFGTSMPRPAVITQTATQYFRKTRPIPSRGLEISQLCDAITHAGLEPEVFEIVETTPILSLIYSYLRLRIPVILVILIEDKGYHAVTITGYSLKQDTQPAKEVSETEKCIPMSGSRIDKFYAHDDQIGPFSELNVISHATPIKHQGRSYSVTFEGGWLKENVQSHLTIYPQFIVIPIYNKIRITFIDLQRQLTKIDMIISSLESDKIAMINHEWDIYLTDTVTFKQSVKGQNLNHDYLKELLLDPQPRFFWRVILTIDETIAVEWLADATDIPTAVPFFKTIWYNDKVKCLFENSKIVDQKTGLPRY